MRNCNKRSQSEWMKGCEKAYIPVSFLGIVSWKSEGVHVKVREGVGVGVGVGAGVVPKGESETFPCTIGVQGKGVKGFCSSCSSRNISNRTTTTTSNRIWIWRSSRRRRVSLRWFHRLSWTVTPPYHMAVAVLGVRVRIPRTPPLFPIGSPAPTRFRVYLLPIKPHWKTKLKTQTFTCRTQNRAKKMLFLL